MKMKRIAIAAVAVLALASFGGAALAKTPAQRQYAPATSSETTTGGDTDNVHEGDQSTPDTGAEATNESGGETATETGGESTGESDGHGAHEDPPGNVDHQFEGQE
jgi:hypothetical protein